MSGNPLSKVRELGFLAVLIEKCRRNLDLLVTLHQEGSHLRGFIGMNVLSGAMRRDRWAATSLTWARQALGQAEAPTTSRPTGKMQQG